jgi:hypothetical protein
VSRENGEREDGDQFIFAPGRDPAGIGFRRHHSFVCGNHVACHCDHDHDDHDDRFVATIFAWTRRDVVQLALRAQPERNLFFASPVGHATRLHVPRTPHLLVVLFLGLLSLLVGGREQPLPLAALRVALSRRPPLRLPRFGSTLRRRR